MASIYLQLNNYKNNHSKFFTYTQESNTTSDKLEDKTKSSLIHQHNINNKIYRNNYYLKRYENYFHKKLVIKYNVLPQEFILIQMDNFIQAKYFRQLAKFKESLIYNDYAEFLKKYYKMKNIMNKIPLLTELYKPYLDFFCFPTFAELRINELIEDMIENKAKMFYKNNYKEEKKKEEKDDSKNKKNETIIFTEKIRKDISRNNTLTDLSKTTIQNNKSDKCSINSILTINNILNFLNNKKNKSNLALKKEYFKNNILIMKKGNNEEIEDKKDKNKNIFNFINNYSLNRNNKININNIKNIINSKNYNKKAIKNEKNCKINITKNKYAACQLKAKYKGLNFKIYGLKTNNLYKNFMENKKLNNINRNSNIEGNSKNKKENKIRSKKLINSLYNNFKMNSIKESIECKTERERGIKISNIRKIQNKDLMDKRLQKFLKIALNFNKSPQKKKAFLYKKVNSKNSKISSSDKYKSKSNKFKNKKRIKSNSNLSENIKNNKKISLKSLGNSTNRINSKSRNYKSGFEEFKTATIKATLKNLKLKKNTKIDCYNSSKKILCSYNKLRLINRNSNFNNKTQKILRTSNNKISFIIKEKSCFSRNNVSHFLSRTNKKVVNNSRIINIKKSLLPISKFNYKS